MYLTFANMAFSWITGMSWWLNTQGHALEKRLKAYNVSGQQEAGSEFLGQEVFPLGPDTRGTGRVDCLHVVLYIVIPSPYFLSFLWDFASLQKKRWTCLHSLPLESWSGQENSRWVLGGLWGHAPAWSPGGQWTSLSSLLQEGRDTTGGPDKAPQWGPPEPSSPQPASSCPQTHKEANQDQSMARLSPQGCLS